MVFFEAAMKLDTDECILWPFALSTNGYGKIGIISKVANGDGTFGAKKTAVYVHRLACERAHGPCPPGMQVCHAPAAVCGHRHCFNPKHLRWGTPSANHADQLKDGTVGNAKLMKHQVNMIRQGLAAGESANSLAARFGVTPTAIRYIENGKSWARVPAKRVIRRPR